MEHSPAILLRKIAWSETSLIVTWLTEQFGAVRTSVRGARRPGSPFAGKLDLFFQEEIGFTISRQGDLHVLREASVTQAFDAGKAGTAGFYLAAYFAELAGLTAPAMQPAPEIYSLLCRALDYLQRTPANEAALFHFERELCRILGVFDEKGAISPLHAIATLCGRVPRSRTAAVQLLAPAKNLSPPAG